MSEKYFKELTQVRAMNGIEAAPLDRNTLPILLNGRSACRVEPSGCICIFPNGLCSPEAAIVERRRMKLILLFSK